MIPMSALGIKWLIEHSATAWQIAGGVGIFLGIAVFLILLPFAVSIRLKSKEYAFYDKGYFEKYEG